MKVKVIHIPKHHIVTYGSGDTTYLIRNPYSRWRWVISLTLRLLFPPGKKLIGPIGCEAG
jgi:hypothetical protein